MKAKRCPFDDVSGKTDRHMLRDENLEAALERLVVTQEHNPVFQNPALPAFRSITVSETAAPFATDSGCRRLHVLNPVEG